MSKYAEYAGPTDDNGDVDLEYVRGTRKKIVAELTKDGIPTSDPDKLKTVLTVLDGIARDAMGKKRIKSEEQSANATQSAALIVAEFLNRSKPTAVTPPANYQPPILGDELPIPPIIEGQTSTIVANETYYEFAARTGLIKDPTKGNVSRNNNDDTDDIGD